jgi:alkanesulfonate monooxygenase
MKKQWADVEFGWYVPTTGDGKYVGVKPQRQSTAEYMISVAQSAEQAGFTFLLIPTGGSCLDAWLVGSLIAGHTRKLKPLVAMRPGLIAPVLAARMASTLDYISNGRALINVVTGGTPPDLQSMGDPLAYDHDARYERTLEFLQIVRSVWINSATKHGDRYLSATENYQGVEKVSFSGKYYELTGGASFPPPVQKPHPPIYFGGSSPAGKRTAAQVADVFLMWPEPVDWIKEQIVEMEQIRHELKQEKGIDRELRYGLRAQVLVRETEEEAWKEAWDIISKVDQGAIEQASFRFDHTDATGQKRQIQLRELSQSNRYVIGPNLWAGLSVVRGGGAMMLVGTPEQVADRILEYVDAGISSFILSGYPHLEEAEITGRLLLPLIEQKMKARESKRVGVS